MSFEILKDIARDWLPDLAMPAYSSQGFVEL